VVEGKTRLAARIGDPRSLDARERREHGRACADDDLRFAAISEMGELIRDESSHDTIELLVALASDPSQPSSLRGAATSALGRGVGLEWKEIPNATRLTPDTPRGEKIMTAARALLASSGG